MLNVARLKVLREVAYRGSLSSAAEALAYTQSAISQQIAALEAETGMTLLERHPRGVSLTAAGQTLVGHAEGILARLDAAEASLSAIAGLRGGRLRMAPLPTASPPLGAPWRPPAIAPSRELSRGVELTLAEGEPEQVAPRLRAAELDLALLFEFPGESIVEGELTRVARLSHPIFPALPRQRALSTRAQVRLEDLAGEAWVQTSRESPCARHVVRS